MITHHTARVRDSAVDVEVRWAEDSSGAWPSEFTVTARDNNVSIVLRTDSAVAMRDALELALAGTRYSNNPVAT